MKHIRKTLLLCLTVLIVQPLTAWSEIGLRELVSNRYKNLIMLKMDKRFLGAKVEIIYSNGEVVSSQTLINKKMIIDFASVKQGEYIIRLSKGEDVKEFKYEKK